MKLKKKLNLSGNYFSFVDNDTDEMKTLCFEDLPDEEVERIIGGATIGLLQEIIRTLNSTLRAVAELTGVDEAGVDIE